MTREELKEHCKRQIQQFERVEKLMPVTPNDWKRYEEHKLIMELLQQETILNKIREQIKSDLRGVEIALEVLKKNDPLRHKMEGAKDTLENYLEIIDKAESEKQE